ncbi:MAG TPA: serine protease [Thiobacillus sp.]
MASFTAPASALDAEKLFEKVSSSIFQIIAEQSQAGGASSGSAVVVGPEQVVTNCHVLQKSKVIHIKHGNTLMRAYLEFPDVERDLCILRVEDLKVAAPPVRELSRIAVGLRVYAIGAPRNMELTLTEGLVSAIRNDRGNKLIQTSAATARGSSGGGLFDDQGNLIGITNAGVSEGLALNFAIPAEYIRDVASRGQKNLAKLDTPKPQTTTTTPAGTPETSQESKRDGGGRRIIGQELVQHFSNAFEATAKGRSSPFILSVSRNGYLRRDCMSCRLQMGTGTFKLDTAANTVCMSWTHIEYPSSSCFALYDYGKGTFTLRTLDGSDSIDYQIDGQSTSG